MTAIIRRPPTLMQRARARLGRFLAGDQRPRYELQIGPGDGGVTVVMAADPYRGGEATRLNKSWQPDLVSGDAAIGANWDLLTRRVRDLQRNDPAIVSLCRTLVDHVIGTGIQTTANVLIDDELDDEFNRESDEAFDWWAETEADVTGKHTWYEIQRQAFAEIQQTGDVLLLECHDPDPKRYLPLCYQVLEAEQLDESKDQTRGDGQNEIRRGVEVDRFKRPVAYWLLDAHPGDTWANWGESIRVPAQHILHLTNPGRPSQTRGVSLYSSITQTARDLDNYLGAELTAANIGALFTLVQKTATPSQGFGFVGDGSDSSTTDTAGNPLTRLGRGIIAQIPKDDDLEQIEASRPNRDARVFTDLILLLMSMGGNVSPYRLTRDYHGTTYVAARAAHLDDRAAFRPLQRYVAARLCAPVRRRWTELAIALHRVGGVSPVQFRAARQRWQRLRVQTTGWEQLDPEKETDSDVAAIAAALSTLEKTCARRGDHWRDNILQRAREEKFAARHGVTLKFDRPSTPGAAGRRDKEEAPKDADS
jgi:lambda family phage portal protein